MAEGPQGPPELTVGHREAVLQLPDDRMPEVAPAHHVHMSCFLPLGRGRLSALPVGQKEVFPLLPQDAQQCVPVPPGRGADEMVFS